MEMTAFHLSSLMSWLSLLILLLPLSSTAADVNYRLDKNTVPASYDVTLKPYLLAIDGTKRFTFGGNVKVTFFTTETAQKTVTLHTRLLNIESVALSDIAGQLIQNVPLDSLSYDQVTNKLTVNLLDPLKPGDHYVLNFVYTGQIRDGLAGLFRANYTDATGNEKWIAVTQSQRIDARTIFPCFDEPAMKAKFRLHLSRPKEYNTVFNTRLQSTESDGEDRYLDHFDWTPHMSTYLFAFILSEFVATGSKNLNVITRTEYVGKTNFALEVAQRALNAYDDYTKLPYHQLGNDLLQNAGSPKFPHNGMENWGLIIYSDGVLVHEPNYSDDWSNKEYTIMIMVHEIAHMWFGNAVTFDWWSYFWLNEAFARYYQYFMAHELYPEYELDQQFVVNQLQMIFGTDATNSTQPMSSPVAAIQTPAQIGSKFSSIAYAKGASILRMFANIMGREKFDTAIRAYLKEYQNSTTVPENLFKHLRANWPAEALSVDLYQLFSDWTEQVGFPVLNVTILSDHEVMLSQRRFLLNPSDGSNPNLTYIIPITYATDFDRNFEDLSPRLYLSKFGEAYFNTEKPIKWIIFNLQQSNYYRVFYDTQTWHNIHKALQQPQHSGIPPANRAQLVDDLFNFAHVGMLEYEFIFEFLEYLATDVDYLPWCAMFKALPRVTNRLTLLQLPKFIEYLGEITATVYAHLGFSRDGDTVLETYNRNRVISWSCKYQLHNCSQEAIVYFDKVVETGVKPRPDFRETLYCSACRDGPIHYYETLLNWFESEKLSSEKEKLVRAMGCTRAFIDNHYLLILSGRIPSEYASIALKPMYTQNPENITPVFIMFTEAIERLAERLGGWSAAANVISDVANYFTTNEQKKMLEDFIAEKGKLFGSDVSKLNSAVQTVQSNLEWADKRLSPMMIYFEQRNAASVRSLAATVMILLAVLYAIHL